MMSIKSSLGKRNDNYPSTQPLGVDFVDYTLKISKFHLGESDTQSSEDKEASNENLNQFSNIGLSDGLDRKKKKYRGSMLGQRTKLYNLDSGYNIPKKLKLNEDEVESKNEDNFELITNEKKAHYLRDESIVLTTSNHEIPEVKSSKENVNSSNTNDFQDEGIEKRKKKYRASMLGQRTKLYNSDTIPNITKNFQLNETEEETNNDIGQKLTDGKKYLSIETPNEKYLKPLHSSSPNNVTDRIQQRLHKSQKENSEESKSPPNPFAYEEASSTFFDSEINNIGAWSVFKNKQKGIKSPSCYSSKEKETETERLSEPSNRKTTIKRNFKTKLFENSCEDSLRNSKSRSDSVELKSTERTKSRERLSLFSQKSYNSIEMTKASPIQFKSVDDRLSHGFDSDAQSDEENEVVSKACDELIGTNQDVDSDESFSKCNTTVITASVEKFVSKTPKLSIICEEDGENDKHCKPSASLLTGSEESLSESHDTTLCEENDVFKRDLEKLNELFFTVQKHSNNMNKMLADLFTEKEIYNSHFDQLQKEINSFHLKYKTSLSHNMTEVNKTVREKKKKRVIPSKVKHSSPVLMLTPENTSASLFTNKSTAKKGQHLQSYSELRKSFSYLQTPERSNHKKPNQVMNTFCYTPKSLSTCISEQLKCLDS